MAEREALLKAEYRDWYPSLVPGTWYSAAWLSEQVLHQMRAGEPTWASELRVPSDAHFSFRGGAGEAGGGLGRRRTDAGPEARRA